MSSALTRRDLIRIAGASAAAALLGPSAAIAHDERPQRKRSIRLAHFTDVHVQPERRAGEGLATALRAMQQLKDKPELILNGGDTIMDSFAADEARTKVQWELWQKVLKDECGVPVQNCLGNHDVWGWNKKESQTSGGEQMWGKKWAMDIFQIAKPYHSFDRGGWHFIALDSTFPQGDGYTAKLDNEQFEWLKGDLAATKAETPICVLSHIPILAAAAFLDGQAEKSGDWEVPGSYMHIDARLIKDVFKQHPNVKACLSGHLHLVDRVEYLGVTYLCNGAVSGGWWRGNHHETEPGFAVVDLFSDGSVEREYVKYGWKAAEA